jgi:hypothetical protein
MPTKRVSVYLTRDYYFKSDLSTVCHTQESYKKYLTSLFQQTETILRRPKNADLVYDIDKQLAVSANQSCPARCRQIIIKWL